MLIIKRLLIAAGILVFSNYSFATECDSDCVIKIFRAMTVRNYIRYLQEADYKNISDLFEKNGVVISNSRGKVNAKEFFYSFLPNVSSAHTEWHQYFVGDADVNSDPDRVTARFHFDFKLKDGEGEGEYIDEFVFSQDSTKIAAVYMFENLKFGDESQSTLNLQHQDVLCKSRAQGSFKNVLKKQ